MYYFFGYVNEVDFHNKSSQFDLALEKFWITHYNLLQLCTTVAMVITITNFLKIFHYRVESDHYEKLIGTR